VRRWGWDRWALVLLVLIGWTLRLATISVNRFHPDEALYGYWGLLIANGRDAWLASVPAYKPPLLPYLISIAQALLGDREFSVRVPGLVASLLVVPLVAALARSLYRSRWLAVAAAMGVALSPFCIQFSSTAYIDPLMVTLGLGACVAAAHGRMRWAGALAGLAFAAKQTGIVWTSLAVAVGLVAGGSVRRFRALVSFAACLAIFAGLVCVWDAVRVAAGAESFWRVGVAAYGGLRLIWPHELWARSRGWITMARYLFVSPVINTTLLIGLLALAWRAVVHRRRTPEAFADLLLASFALAYLLFHWLVAFPIWDRYLLPLVPVLAILLGRTVGFLVSWVVRSWPSIDRGLVGATCCLVLSVALAWPAFTASQGRYPIGSYNQACDGLDQVVAFLRSRPEGAVVYQHWLGWQYAYYLFGGPAYLAYWPTPAWLAQDVAVFGTTSPRYVTFPSLESSARVERALAGVGYKLEPALTATRSDGTSSFAVYSIQPLLDQ
jgi:4-amino-4-deoxy-L-arabinose transferase-like glycosyltransferase